MTLQQTGDLLKLIQEQYSPQVARLGKPVVKYVHPNIDIRTGHCFSITLRGYGWEESFHTQNECSELKESLYDRVVTFLGGDQKSGIRLGNIPREVKVWLNVHMGDSTCGHEFSAEMLNSATNPAGILALALLRGVEQVVAREDGNNARKL